MEKIYAQALWQLVRDGEEPKKAVKKLHEYLVKRGHTGLLRKIARTYEDLSTHEAERNTVTLLVAHRDDATHARHAVGNMLTQLHLADRHVVTRVDHSIIGGWRTEGREHLVDASYKRFLLDIYSRATKQ